LQILLVARLLTDERDRRMQRAFAENGVRAALQSIYLDLTAHLADRQAGTRRFTWI